jgi:ATP synthase protein I
VTPDPERRLVRRAIPFAPVAFVVALVAGAAAAGWSTGWSAAIGVALVAVNAIVAAELLARAARISLTAYAAAVMGGFVVRLGAILAVMFALNRLAWFSPLAFGLAVVPATILLLGYEAKLLAGGMGSELQLPPPDALRGRMVR